jgi:hypothetical protein
VITLLAEVPYFTDFLKEKNFVHGKYILCESIVQFDFIPEASHFSYTIVLQKRNFNVLQVDLNVFSVFCEYFFNVLYLNPSIAAN